MESYLKQGKLHVGEDQEVHEGEVRQIQRIMNGHSRMLVRIFQVGEQGGDGGHVSGNQLIDGVKSASNERELNLEMAKEVCRNLNVCRSVSDGIV